MGLSSDWWVEKLAEEIPELFAEKRRLVGSRSICPDTVLLRGSLSGSAFVFFCLVGSSGVLVHKYRKESKMGNIPPVSTVWVTKYALTSGIQKREVLSVTGRMVKVKPFSGEFQSVYFHGDDWHTDLDAAIAHVKAKASRKKWSLQKQILKLESIIQNGPRIQNG